MEGSEIVRSEPNHLGDRLQLTQAVLDAERRQRAMLAEFVRGHMVKEVDYGIIPGTPKPSLLKPGAEKLVDLLRCTPRFTLLKAVEDFDRGFFYYRFRVRLIQRESGAVLAEGFGSANSREARYRWRNASRRCPACGKDAIIQGKAEYGGGWVCFKKKNGCGEKFRADDPTIVNQALGRVENEDIADLDNTILKMAKKRALVDGAIALARCSDMFTQDVEDFSHGQSAPPPQEASPAPRDDEPPPPSERDAPPPQETPQSGAQRRWEKRDEVSGLKDEPVNFGPHKGRLMSALSLEELGESYGVAMEKLEQDAKEIREAADKEGVEKKPARWVGALKRQLGLIEQWRAKKEREAEERTKQAAQGPTA